MFKKLQCFGLFTILTVIGLDAQQSETQLSYIERYKDIAIQEMERSGIPASIKLAQGLLESNAGQSMLARRANNHFGIKCGANWEGDTVYREDDDYDENGKLIKSCFRSYKNNQASYIAHSEFLRDPRKAFRYGFLFRLDPKDYRRWAYGLKQAGYATSPTYPEKLISLIERYELFRYDNATAVDIDTPSDIVASGILDNNDVRYVVAAEGEALEDIALRVDVSVRNLINYNDNLNNSEVGIQEGDRVYLQPKRNSYRGRQKYHTVKAGESMFAIAQQYGVKLSKLYKRNRLTSGQEPGEGEKIKLRGGKIRETPKLRKEIEEATPPNSTTIPVLPNGELDMEEPEPDTDAPATPPVPSTPANPVIVQPETPNSGTPTEVPIIIIGPGSNPAPPAGPTTNPPSPVGNPTVEPTPVPVRPDTTSPSPPVEGQPQYHTVVAGETLYGISKRYNTTVELIQSLNGLNSNIIQAGMRLRVQ